MERVDEFILLFNQIEHFFTEHVKPVNFIPFKRLIDIVAADNAAVKMHSSSLRKFAMLRNAILHDENYPHHIVAVPSDETLKKFKKIARDILTPLKLGQIVESDIVCFSLNDFLHTTIEYMGKYDFSQIIARGHDGNLKMITSEGIMWWLANQIHENEIRIDTVRLADLLSFEPPDSFTIMSSENSIFDAAEAFKDSVHINSNRLYAILVMAHGDDGMNPKGIITPWDLVHNPKFKEWIID
jgi:predicted transcriptional regulator